MSVPGPLADVQLFTVAEVAVLFRLSKGTVYRMVQSGTLPGLKVGRSVRIPRPSVEQFLLGTGSGGH